ncbi:hypothetical protein [Rhodopila globiformis]|uniref:Uncharacterized protein n=1 Tax=Rhodopila globiformis TaxID=1071 RepID=A0A2S6N483_RHOGL|nr:hypothetical protein [Rhodopila globiformis]PPQ29431.1 hypothetical protein CCS01_21680 [Rhodopila globiformis]
MRGLVRVARLWQEVPASGHLALRRPAVLVVMHAVSGAMVFRRGRMHSFYEMMACQAPPAPIAALFSDGKSIPRPCVGDCAPKCDIPRFIALPRRGKLRMQKLRTGTITLDETNQGFGHLSDGTVPRQIRLLHG